MNAPMPAYARPSPGSSEDARRVQVIWATPRPTAATAPVQAAPGSPAEEGRADADAHRGDEDGWDRPAKQLGR